MQNTSNRKPPGISGSESLSIDSENRMVETAATALQKTAVPTPIGGEGASIPHAENYGSKDHLSLDLDRKQSLTPEERKFLYDYRTEGLKKLTWRRYISAIAFALAVLFVCLPSCYTLSHLDRAWTQIIPTNMDVLRVFNAEQLLVFMKYHVLARSLITIATAGFGYFLVRATHVLLHMNKKPSAESPALKTPLDETISLLKQVKELMPLNKPSGS